MNNDYASLPFQTVVFEGVPSGDYENFCWDVELDTFKKLTEDNPHLYQSHFYKNLYRYYGGPDISKEIRRFHENKDQFLKVEVTTQQTDNDCMILIHIDKLNKFAESI